MKNLILLLLLFLFSCGNTTISNQKVQQKQQSFNGDKKHSCVSINTNGVIVKNIFNIDIFRSDTTKLKTIFKISPSIKISKEKGDYDDNEYLTFLFETPKSFVKFFKNDEGFYIENALIKGNEIRLYKNIEIGMIKNDFCKLLSINQTPCDTIVITDEDQFLNLNFVFSNDELKELEIISQE
ncbi:MAG: hypothetical protein NTY32_01410 [Bacteroidia bacterium]|nr:hypothetical protein [Bacteroidia bacterium]